MQAPPCKFFNSDKGCKFSPTECKRPHVPFCTNKVCVSSKTEYTHSLSICGRKAKPQPERPTESFADKVAKARNDVCEKLYVKVEKILKDTESELSEVVKFKPSAGKIVGMFNDGFDLNELTNLLSDDSLLQTHMADAVDVLRVAYEITGKP